MVINISYQNPHSFISNRPNLEWKDDDKFGTPEIRISGFDVRSADITSTVETSIALPDAIKTASILAENEFITQDFIDFSENLAVDGIELKQPMRFIIRTNKEIAILNFFIFLPNSFLSISQSLQTIFQS